jgi:SAM-dependent methyltransferase
MNTLPVRSSQDYWNTVAETYDQVFPDTLIGRTQREVVWQELGRAFRSGQRILELNCGTGVDAVHLAGSGVRVLACDISPRMIEIARRRALSERLAGRVEFKVLPTEDIAMLGDQAPFDGVFSNFSGLNHVVDLPTLAQSLAQLLKPGARALLCLAGPFAPAEMAWYLAHGKLRQAMRRFTRLTDDVTLKVHYPSVATMAQIFAPAFRLQEWKGIGIAVPSCMEHMAQRIPKAYEKLARADRWLGQVPVLRGWADCVLLQFERVGR